MATVGPATYKKTREKVHSTLGWSHHVLKNMHYIHKKSGKRGTIR